MARALAICRSPGCPNLGQAGYCPDHEATSSRNHYGVSRHDRGHGAEYEARRAQLIGKPCHHCGKPADTADYLVPVSQGGTLDDLVPSCAHCNYARGVRMVGAASKISPATPPPQYRAWPDSPVIRVQSVRPRSRRWFA